MSTRFRRLLGEVSFAFTMVGWVTFWVIVAGAVLRRVWEVATGQADILAMALVIAVAAALSWLLGRVARK